MSRHGSGYGMNGAWELSAASTASTFEVGKKRHFASGFKARWDIRPFVVKVNKHGSSI